MSSGVRREKKGKRGAQALTATQGRPEREKARGAAPGVVEVAGCGGRPLFCAWRGGNSQEAGTAERGLLGKVCVEMEAQPCERAARDREQSLLVRRHGASGGANLSGSLEKGLGPGVRAFQAAGWSIRCGPRREQADLGKEQESVRGGALAADEKRQKRQNRGERSRCDGTTAGAAIKALGAKRDVRSVTRG